MPPCKATTDHHVLARQPNSTSQILEYEISYSPCNLCTYSWTSVHTCSTCSQMGCDVLVFTQQILIQVNEHLAVGTITPSDNCKQTRVVSLYLSRQILYYLIPSKTPGKIHQLRLLARPDMDATHLSPLHTCISTFTHLSSLPIPLTY